MSINILDNLIINRISAGEVAESPFSVVKELLDNALDAGSTKIQIEIKNGGADLISVKDNGSGIEREDIIKAFLPHATSKIFSIDDLEHIETLGFRGEALASISNVSHTTILTKTNDSELAYFMEVNAGKFGEIEPTTGEIGTKIEVKNLFYNTPARRKFMKKPKQEENQITNIIARYIMAHPDISIKYVADGEVIYNNKGGELIDAIACVYGNEIKNNLLYVEKGFGNLKISGYVSKVGFSKPNTTYQTLILNSRYVIDDIVSKAAYMAYEEYLMSRQFPFYVLNLDMPSVDVDVNVHPSKMNVKFANPGKIYDLVYSSIRASIYNSLTLGNSKSNNYSEENVTENLIKTDVDSLKEIELEPTVKIEDFHSPKIELRQTTYTPITIYDVVNSKEKSNEKEFEKVETILENTENINKKFENLTENSENILKNDAKIENFEKKSSNYIEISELVDFKVLGELFNEFLIIEHKDNLILMDFHAAHERLNFDKFTEMINNRTLVIQDLLVPYVQELSPVEVEYIMSLHDRLFELGFDVDEFGENKIKINSIPMQLKDINLKNFVDDLVHDMKNLKPKINSEIIYYLKQKACKSSVKSGMKLTDMEISSLLHQLSEKNPVLLCPHGRPVMYQINRSQIEKWFKRIV